MPTSLHGDVAMRAEVQDDHTQEPWVTDQDAIVVPPIYVKNFSPFTRVLDPLHVDLKGFLELEGNNLFHFQPAFDPLLFVKNRRVRLGFVKTSLWLTEPIFQTIPSLAVAYQGQEENEGKNRHKLLYHKHLTGNYSNCPPSQQL
jgi:hypothetical protein